MRVPQYSSATLGSTLTAAAWDGSTGGILAVDVSGTLSLGGATVSVSGLGFRGGGARQLAGDTGGANTDYVQDSAKNFDAAKGEGIAGTPRWVYNSALGTLVDTRTDYPMQQGAVLTTDGGLARGGPGTAGGGGTDGHPAGNDENSGGGGGGNGGGGGKGGKSWSSGLDVGGFGGVAFPAAAAQVALGAGGGAGTRNNSSGRPLERRGGWRHGHDPGRQRLRHRHDHRGWRGRPGAGERRRGRRRRRRLHRLHRPEQHLDRADRCPPRAARAPTRGHFGPGHGLREHSPRRHAATTTDRAEGAAAASILLSSAATCSSVTGGVNGTTCTDANPYGATGGGNGDRLDRRPPDRHPGLQLRRRVPADARLRRRR